jgi:nucleotide-binding universal stress UspA family protein
MTGQPYVIDRILVPVDGSACSRHAAERAVRLAGAHDAEVVFLHVVDAQVVEQLAQEGSDDGVRARDRLLANGQVYLRDVAKLAADGGVAHRETIAEGDPCTVICDTAARADVDLIVMGKIGRRGARRILMGSITRRVVEATDRPVLIFGEPAAAEDGARVAT